MNLVAKLLRPANVLLDLDVASKKRVFEQIGLLIENSHHVSRGVVFDSLFNREKLGSTGLGQGLAIPHGRVKGLRETICVFARTVAGIPFDAPDGQPVTMIFAILVPEHATEQHLRILSEVAQIFGDKALREQLLACTEVAAAHRLLTEWSPYADRHRSAAV